MPEFETLGYAVEDGVATVTLDRPDRHNAFNTTMAGELARAWDAVRTDPDVVCAIVTGAGDRAFCTGMDVADVASGQATDSGRGDREAVPWNRLTPIQNRCWKPVIAAINGMVVGGGLHFVVDSDIVVCSETATFFDTHVKGRADRGPRARGPSLGRSRSRRCCGSRCSAAVSACLPPRRIGSAWWARWSRPSGSCRARARAREDDQRALADRARDHQAVHLGEPRPRARRCASSAPGTRSASTPPHPDLEEGARAFVEKRKPRWAPYTGS